MDVQVPEQSNAIGLQGTVVRKRDIRIEETANLRVTLGIRDEVRHVDRCIFRPSRLRSEVALLRSGAHALRLPPDIERAIAFIGKGRSACCRSLNRGLGGWFGEWCAFFPRGDNVPNGCQRRTWRRLRTTKRRHRWRVRESASGSSVSVGRRNRVGQCVSKGVSESVAERAASLEGSSGSTLSPCVGYRCGS
jgi:hypothetical protein